MEHVCALLLCCVLYRGLLCWYVGFLIPDRFLPLKVGILVRAAGAAGDLARTPQDVEFALCPRFGASGLVSVIKLTI